MPKANDTDIYKFDLAISLTDYLFGTDSVDGKKNKSYKIKDIIQLINGVNGKNNLQYAYSDGTNPDISQYNTGYFFTDTLEADPLLFSQLILNKNSLQPIDLSTLFMKLDELQDVVIKLDNPVDPNNFFNFKIVSITNETDYFVFEVVPFKDFYSGLFLNETIYSLYFDIKSATDSDPLKLDKSTYTGNAKNLDDRIIALENFQDTNTKFTGQAFAVWTGAGFIYDVIYPSYYINGVLYPGATDQIILNASDAIHPRLDVIAVDATGAIKITGVAEVNPLVPTVNDDTQIAITTVLVNANTTAPAITEEVIYKENTEWTGVSNIGTLNFNAVTTPFQGAKHIDCGAFTNNQYIRFTNVASHQIADFATLKFYLNLKGAFSATTKFIIKFYNDGVLVSSGLKINSGSYNFNRLITNAYQTIVIPLSSFTFTTSTFDQIDIQMFDANALGFRLDNIILSADINSVSPKQNAITTIITDNGIANATSPDDTISMIGAGKTTISASGKRITVDTPSEVVNAITNGDLTHSPSGDAVFGGLALKVDKDGAKVLSDVNFSTALSNKLASIDATHYLAPLQTTIQLSALPQATVTDKARVYVENELSDYFYDVTATFGDIAPDDQVGGIGYWRKVAVGGETAASIKAKYESNADTNAFTDTLKAKLDSITAIFTTALKATYDGVVTGYDALMLTGSRLITSGEITKLSNTSGTNTGDQDLSGKQDTLVSGTNIKTINGASVLGSGDITISGGGGDMTTTTDQTVSGIKTFLNGKFGLRNIADTFTSFFTNTNTASRTYTLQNRSGIVADDTDLALKKDFLETIEFGDAVSYTVNLENINKLTVMRDLTGSGNMSIVVPTNATVPLPIGTVKSFVNNSPGNYTMIVSGSGVTFKSNTLSFNVNDQIDLIKIGTNTWDIVAVTSLPSYFEYLSTNNTIWNNGKGNIDSNTSFGRLALNSISSGYNNTGYGLSAMQSVSTGIENTVMGVEAMKYCGGGASYNTAIGCQSLLQITGSQNTGIGFSVLVAAIFNSNNVALGNYALFSLSTGQNNNTVVGFDVFRNLVTGSENVALGSLAGKFKIDGSNLNSLSSSIMLGAYSKAKSEGGTNEIVIGHTALGNGSNTVTLGNDSIVRTYLKGVVNAAKTYTVATLPTGVLGDKTIVTDATAPTYLGALIGGGSVVCPVFYNGTIWVSN